MDSEKNEETEKKHVCGCGEGGVGGCENPRPCEECDSNVPHNENPPHDEIRESDQSHQDDDDLD